MIVSLIQQFAAGKFVDQSAHGGLGCRQVVQLAVGPRQQQQGVVRLLAPRLGLQALA